MYGEMLEVGEIEAIKPDHGPRAVFAVVVPVPRRREDHVAPLHLDSSAVDGCEPALPLDDEPHRESDMPVGLGSLIGHHELQPCVQGVGRERCICEDGERWWIS